MPDIAEEVRHDPERIEAPWTPTQVVALNEWQQAGHVHPFTCPHRSEHGVGAALVATVNGWICSYCGYTQNWAFRQMLKVPDPPFREAARSEMWHARQASLRQASAQELVNEFLRRPFAEVLTAWPEVSSAIALFGGIKRKPMVLPPDRDISEFDLTTPEGWKALNETLIADMEEGEGR